MKFLLSIFVFLSLIISCFAIEHHGPFIVNNASLPVNTVTPTVSSANPLTGVAETSTDGTWTGSPTITRQWVWADTSSNISGATSTSYTPVNSDITHTLKLAVTATNIRGSVTTYSSTTNMTAFYTTFPSTETHISQGGIWVDGCSSPLNNWGCIATVGGSPGHAYGTTQPSFYADPSAILTGITLSANQWASATIAQDSGNQGLEAEVRLRATATTNNLTGYEVYCSVTDPATSGSYIAITKWKGALSQFSVLIQTFGSQYGCVTGTVLKGTITGSPPTITAYENGTQVAQVTDSNGSGSGSDGTAYWTSGSIGLGFWGAGGTSTDLPNFRETNFSGGNL